MSSVSLPARAGTRRFWLLSTPRAHTKTPYKTGLLWETLGALKRPRGPGPRMQLVRALLAGVAVRVAPAHAALGALGQQGWGQAGPNDAS
jgi:hypothetical protein